MRDIGSSVNFGGLGGVVLLKPGEAFQEEISVSKWFAFDKKGRYDVFGSYELTFGDPSNEPPSMIWADYVSAKFVVRID